MFNEFLKNICSQAVVIDNLVIRYRKLCELCCLIIIREQRIKTFKIVKKLNYQCKQEFNNLVILFVSGNKFCLRKPNINYLRDPHYKNVSRLTW